MFILGLSPTHPNSLPIFYLIGNQAKGSCQASKALVCTFDLVPNRGELDVLQTQFACHSSSLPNLLVDPISRKLVCYGVFSLQSVDCHSQLPREIPLPPTILQRGVEEQASTATMGKKATLQFSFIESCKL